MGNEAQTDEEKPAFGEGHNAGDDGQSISVEELKLLVERIERLEEEKKAAGDDVKDVYAEAKARGFAPKAIRECIRLRKQDANARAEWEALLDTYKAALGLSFGETPLGRAAGMGGRRTGIPLAELAVRLQEMGATVKVTGGKTSIVIPAGMADAELDVPTAGGGADEGGKGGSWLVRDPSDGTVRDESGLATLDD